MAPTAEAAADVALARRLDALLHSRSASAGPPVHGTGNGRLPVAAPPVVHLPGFNVKARNAVGAGDAFNGGFVAARVEGRPMIEALR